MAITTDKLLKLSQLSTVLTETKNYVDTEVGKKATKATTLSGYGITDAYTKTEIDGKVSSAMHYKGTVANYAALPTAEVAVGDTYNVTESDTTHNIKAGDNVAWNGSEWDVLSGVVDTSGLLTLTSLSAEVTGTGNAITGFTYDNTTGKFTANKGATYLTENDVTISVATDAEITAACKAVFG